MTGTSNKGAICPECGEMVKSPVEETLEPTVWFRAPEGIDGLMNIGIYTMLDLHFKRKDFSFIRWITDPRYAPEQEPLRLMPGFRDAIESAGIERGWNSFVRNFDVIFKILVETVGLDDKAKHDRIFELVQFIRENRHLVFCKHIPLPNKSLFVVEESNMGPWADYTILDAIDAIRTIVGIDTPEKNFTTRVKEGRVAKATALLSDFIKDQYEKLFHPKPGLFRKQKFGIRSHFSFRAVISSITGVHDYLDMHIPWSVGCVVFRPMIMNKLFARGFTVLTARRYLNAHTREYSPILDEIFQEIISDTGLKGYPAQLQRNPSLERASMLLQFITKVKTDLSDPTISMSILGTRGFNADFDGRLLPSLNLSNSGKLSILDVYYSCVEIQHDTCRVIIQSGIVKTSSRDTTDAAKLLTRKAWSGLRGHRNRLERGKGSRVGETRNGRRSVNERRYGPQVKTDALNAMIQFDLSLMEPLSNLLPHKSAFDFEMPKELSKNLSLSKPSVAYLNNWMQFKHDVDPAKLEKMFEFAA